MDGDSKVAGYLGKTSANVAAGPEPELAAMRQASSECLADKKPCRVIGRADCGRVVKQGPRIKNLEHFGMRSTDCAQVGVSP